MNTSMTRAIRDDADEREAYDEALSEFAYENGFDPTNEQVREMFDAHLAMFEVDGE